MFDIFKELDIFGEIRKHKYLNGDGKSFTHEEKLELFSELLHEMFPDFENEKKGHEKEIRDKIAQTSQWKSETQFTIYEKNKKAIKFELVWWCGGKILGECVTRSNGLFLCLYEGCLEKKYEKLKLEEIYQILGV